MRRFGFTLVELIVITAIIAVLIAVLIPSLAKSRQQTKAIVCMSNIRQLTSVFEIYVNDNSKFPYGLDSTHTLPPPGGFPGNSAYDRAGWWWFNNLGNLYKKGKDFKTLIQCPSRQITQRGLAGDILCGNYGVNLSICKRATSPPDQNEFFGKQRADSEVMRPAQTLLILDSGYAIINWHHAADFPPVPLDNSNIENTAYIPGLSINRQRQFIAGQEIDAIYGRHPQMMVNTGFADGHAARMGAEDFLVKKIPSGDYANKYPLWTLTPK
jgi:prepilin-type processing-associated H-X9-DG protein